MGTIKSFLGFVLASCELMKYLMRMYAQARMDFIGTLSAAQVLNRIFLHSDHCDPRIREESILSSFFLSFIGESTDIIKLETPEANLA
mmetsp:Transcript_25034/g.42640  ORF Transcript_25034/g.42640 Transcript_25034/m.42640 type:complete len:88 (-) Transcript_25034:640-903(-)